MKVYIVVGDDYGGSDIGDVFLDRDTAEENARLRNKFKNIWDTHMSYEVVEKEVSHDKEAGVNKNRLAIKIDGYIVFDDIQDPPEISAVVAEDWCKGNFDDIGDFISVDAYIKATESDFDLSQEALAAKYGYVWEDILSMSLSMKNQGIELEDIAQAIKSKYTITWE